MNKNYTKLAVFLAVIIVAALILYVKEQIEIKSGAKNPATQQAAQTTGYDVSKIQKETFSDTSNPGLEIHGEYPVNIVGAEYIKGIIDTKLAQFKTDSDPSKLTTQELAEFGPTKDHQYSFITEYKAYANNSFLTHRLDTYTYTGGAHGGTAADTYTYNKDGKMVVPSDLFSGDAAVATFSGIVRTHALALPDYKESINTEWLADSTGLNASDYKAFAFSGANLIIIFQQYAIAPYSSGIIEVPIPLSELSGVLKPEYLK